MKKQELFDRVATHLLTQNKQCVDTAGGCMYRFRGKSCAIGCLIPKNKYNKNFEGEGVGEKVIQEAAGLTPSQADGLASELQEVHDNYEPEEWAYHLRETARTNKVSARVVDRLEK